VVKVMCGIAGIFHPARPERPDPALLAAMTGTLSHRGPDDEGFHLAPGIGLGFRRLSIVDLATGNQPILSEDGEIVSVCNGEIYNFPELRAELEARGHRFRTRVDTEVLPAMYREWGPDFVSHLSGQFAFAVWDARERRLVLGRDPVGIAPLFHAEIDGALVFASEIKAILARPDAPRRVNPTALDQILTFPGPVSPHTIFAGIDSLPPGHILIAEADGRRTLRRYWDLDYPCDADIDRSRSVDDLVDELDSALRTAVRRRLQSDVPVAAYLSGGLDSSLIAAILADLTPGAERHTFSIAFEDRDIDESGPQRLMAAHLGSIHHETRVGADAINARLTDIVRHAEAPLRESYDACSLILSGMVRANGIKVVMTGEGADELFGGYVGYRLDVERAGACRDDDDIEAMLEAETRARLWGDPDFFYEKNYLVAEETRRSLYSTALAARFEDFDCLRMPPVGIEALAGRHAFHKRSYLDFKLRMADHLLADHGDRVAFANSVEARYPFLDIGVINVARRIPPEVMVQDGIEKYPLKRLARRYLPDEIVDRPKFSFVAPSAPALLRSALPLIDDMLSRERIERGGYFNPDAVERLKSLYRRPDFDLNQTFEDDLLMVVLTFNILLDLFDLPNLS